MLISGALLLVFSLAHPCSGRETALNALARLKRGNHRFVEKSSESDHQALRPFVDGQRPHTVVLSCSDSRVPVEVVFDQTLGDMFVVRVAGQALDTSVIASIEYALENLDVRLIVVLAHEGCGAIKAVINTPVGESSGSAHIDALIADIRPRIAAVAVAPASRKVLRESTANALGVMADLPHRSTVIRSRLAADRLIIVAALYHLSSGNVEWLEDNLNVNETASACSAGVSTGGASRVAERVANTAAAQQCHAAPAAESEPRGGAKGGGSCGGA